MSIPKPQIMTPTDSYVTVYPEFIKLANTQFEDCRWTANEIEVEKDKQDMLVNMSPAARHAITTGLKLFTKYEMFAGTEYWMGRIVRAFPRPEVQRLASVNGMMELHVHAPFYNKLNETLGLDTDEFYTSYVDDPVLNSRVKFLDKYVDSKDDLLSVAVFSMMEGGVLFANFAVFKSCQSKGNNMIGNTVRGIDQSVVDEGLHQIGGAMLFRKAIEELKFMMSPEDFAKMWKSLCNKIRRAAKKLAEHEFRISEMLMSEGDIGTGITAESLKQFVMSRINICLQDLGVPVLFSKKQIGANPIAGWFYNGVQKMQLNDFFVGQGREYTSHWKEEDFEWLDEEEDTNEQV
jgi:ribonucleotide reductase beta subunit family protein with ferritin-like domain